MATVGDMSLDDLIKQERKERLKTKPAAQKKNIKVKAVNGTKTAKKEGQKQKQTLAQRQNARKNAAIVKKSQGVNKKAGGAVPMSIEKNERVAKRKSRDMKKTKNNGQASGSVPMQIQVRKQGKQRRNPVSRAQTSMLKGRSAKPTVSQNSTQPRPEEIVVFVGSDPSNRAPTVPIKKPGVNVPVGATKAKSQAATRPVTAVQKQQQRPLAGERRTQNAINKKRGAGGAVQGRGRNIQRTAPQQSRGVQKPVPLSSRFDNGPKNQQQKQQQTQRTGGGNKPARGGRKPARGRGGQRVFRQ